MSSETYSLEMQHTMETLEESQENSLGNRKWVSKFFKSFSTKKRERNKMDDGTEDIMGVQGEYSKRYADYNGMIPTSQTMEESNLYRINEEDQERNAETTNSQTDEQSYPRLRVSKNPFEMETIEVEEGGNIKNRKTTLRKTGRFLHRVVEEEQKQQEPTNILSELPKLIKAGKIKLDESQEITDEESVISTTDKTTQEENQTSNPNSNEQGNNTERNLEAGENYSKNPFMTNESIEIDEHYLPLAEQNQNNKDSNQNQEQTEEKGALEEPYQDVENILQTLTDTIKCIEDREIAELLVRLRTFKRGATMRSSETASSGKKQKTKLWGKSKNKQATETDVETKDIAEGNVVEYEKEETSKCFGRQKKKLHPSYSRPTITLTMSKGQMSRLSDEEQSTVIQLLRSDEQEEMLHIQDTEKKKTFNIIKKPTLINGTPIEEFNLSMEDLLNEPNEIRDEILQITHSLAQEDKQEEKEGKNKKKKKKGGKKKKGLEHELTTEEFSEAEEMLREEQLKKDLQKLREFALMIETQREEQRSLENLIEQNELNKTDKKIEEPNVNERPASQQSLRDELEKEKIMNEMLSREKELYIKLDNENAELETLQRIREENGIEEDTTDLLEREEKLKEEIELTKTEIEILQRQRQQKREREKHHNNETDLIEEYPSLNNKNKQNEEKEYVLFIKKVKKEWENTNEKKEPIKVVSMSFNELVSLPDSLIQLSLNCISPEDRTTLLNAENQDQKYNFIIYEELAEKGPLGRNFASLKGNKSKVESLEEALSGEAATIRISHNELVDLSDDQIEIILNQLSRYDRKSIMWTKDDDHKFTFYLLNPEDDMGDNEKGNTVIVDAKKGKEKLIDRLKLKKNKKQTDEQNKMKEDEEWGKKCTTNVIEISKAEYDKFSTFGQNEIKKLLAKKDIEELKHSKDPDKIHKFYIKGEKKKHIKEEKERLNKETKTEDEKKDEKKQKKNKKKNEKYDEEEDNMYKCETEEAMIDYLQQNGIALFLDICDLQNMLNTQHPEMVDEEFQKQTALDILEKQKNLKKKKNQKKKKKRYEVIRISKKELFDRSPSGQKEIIDSLEEQDIRKLLAVSDPDKIHGFFVKEMQKYTWGKLKSSTIDRLKGNHRKTLQDFQEEIEKKRREDAEKMDVLNESIENEKNHMDESDRILQLQKLLKTEKVEGAQDMEQARIEQVLSEEELRGERPFITPPSSNIHQKKLSELHADILNGKKANYVIILSKGVLLRQTPYIRKAILEVLDDQEAATILTEENPKKVFTLPLKKETQVKELYNWDTKQKEEEEESATGSRMQRSETWKELMRRKTKEILEKKDKKKKEKDEKKKKNEEDTDEKMTHNVDVCYSDDEYYDEPIEEKPSENIYNKQETDMEIVEEKQPMEDDEIPGPSGMTPMKLENFSEENKPSVDDLDDWNEDERSSEPFDQRKTFDSDVSTNSSEQVPYKINPSTTRIVLAPFQFKELSPAQQQRLLNLISEFDRKVIEKSFKKKKNKHKQYVFEVTDVTTEEGLTPEPYMKIFLSQDEFFRLNDLNQKRVLNFLSIKGQQELLGALQTAEKKEYHLKPKYAPDEISLSDLNLSEMEKEKPEHKLLRLSFHDLDSSPPDMKKEILNLIPRKEQKLILNRKDPMELLILNLNKKYKKKISKATKANLDVGEDLPSENIEANDNMDSKDDKEAKKKRKKEKKEEKKKKKEEKKGEKDGEIEEKDNEAAENEEKKDGEDDQGEEDKKDKKKEKKKKDKKEKKKKKKSKKGGEVVEEEQQNVEAVEEQKEMDISEELPKDEEPIYAPERGLDGIMEPLTLEEMENAKKQQIDINKEQEEKEIAVLGEVREGEEPREEEIKEEEEEKVEAQEGEIKEEEQGEGEGEETQDSEIGKKRTEKKNYLEDSTYPNMDKTQDLNRNIVSPEPRIVNYRFVSEDEFLEDISKKYLADIPQKNQKKLLKKLKKMQNFDDLRVIEEEPEIDYEKELEQVVNIPLDQYKDDFLDEEVEELLDNDLDMVYSLTIEPSKLTDEQKMELLKKLPYSDAEVKDILTKFKKSQCEIDGEEKEESDEEEEEEPSTFNEDNAANMNLPFPEILNHISIDYLINLPEEEKKELIGILTTKDYNTLMSVNEPEEKMQLLREKIEGYSYNDGEETEEIKETKDRWLEKLKSEGMKQIDPMGKQKGKKKKKET